ncbi:hypothetical protein E2C01_019193 [Portunus trituberculatus]|uniref:Uncharacterized protein n=1 Tax=Portunus trituberculatus TaxID=210409 RepID=A0A5B7DYK7_PORTR|nr:hypothetical protein [Portunus trituberculatus]
MYQLDKIDEKELMVEIPGAVWSPLSSGTGGGDLKLIFKAHATLNGEFFGPPLVRKSVKGLLSSQSCFRGGRDCIARHGCCERWRRWR